MRVLFFLCCCAIIGILTAGCALDPTYTIDTAFTPDERTAILEAGEILNQYVKPEYQLAFGDGDWFIRREKPPGELAGHTSRTDALIKLQPATDYYVVPDYTPEETYQLQLAGFRVMAMHELLHSLGLKHTASGIMAAKVITIDPVLTEADLAECRRVEVCP